MCCWCFLLLSLSLSLTPPVIVVLLSRPYQHFYFFPFFVSFSTPLLFYFILFYVCPLNSIPAACQPAQELFLSLSLSLVFTK